MLPQTDKFNFEFAEEVITKRVTDVTTTKNIETRVQREITLKDGVVIDDSGPIVETHTTEDVEKQESEQTEVSENVTALSMHLKLIVIDLHLGMYFQYNVTFIIK